MSDAPSASLQFDEVVVVGNLEIKAIDYDHKLCWFNSALVVNEIMFAGKVTP